ncbi:hypothetical protein MBRA_06462 [Methylobacterium brachiatum]|jgi:hypothetical protein|nr:hypothetical protein MBRA_06462 [Methylobacterium brachiatum]
MTQHGPSCPHCNFSLSEIFLESSAEPVPVMVLMDDAPPVALAVDPDEVGRVRRCHCGVDVMAVHKAMYEGP